MGTKLNTAAGAVQYLRDQAWLAVESRKGNRAERLHFCADLIAEMGQDLEDAIELADEAAHMMCGSDTRISVLREAHERLDARLGLGRGPIADAAHDVIDTMYEEAVFAATGDIPHLCDDPSCPGIYASAPQEAAQGPSCGARLPTQPEDEDGAVAATEEPVADFMMAMQDVVDAYAKQLSSVEMVGAMELVKDEVLMITRLGTAEYNYGVI